MSDLVIADVSRALAECFPDRSAEHLALIEEWRRHAERGTELPPMEWIQSALLLLDREMVFPADVRWTRVEFGGAARPVVPTRWTAPSTHAFLVTRIHTQVEGSVTLQLLDRNVKVFNDALLPQGALAFKPIPLCIAAGDMIGVETLPPQCVSLDGLLVRVR